MRVVTTVFLFVLLVVTEIMYPSPVDRVSASKAAAAKLSELGVQNIYRQTGMFDVTDGAANLYGYLVTLSPAGFLLLTADSEYPPVMAYSLENSAGNIEEGNPLLEMFIADITLLNRNKGRLPAGVTRQNNSAWKELLNGGSSEKHLTLLQWPPAGSTPTGGLLTTNWTQNAPYNNLCPKDLVSGGNRSLAGCPAVAMAQILNYLKTTNNTTFTDNDDYYHNYGGNRYWVDNDAVQYGFPTFSVLNDYLRSLQTNFVPGGTVTNTEKAALVFACGVAAKQVYGASGSGTFEVSQAYAAFQKFHFANAELLMPDDTNLYRRTAMNVIDSLPVHMATVTPANDAGHNFVVDGYNSENFFHLNFGWGGSYNGWYKIPEGIPYNLTTMEGTIVGIYTGSKQQDCNDEPADAVLIQPSENTRVYKIDCINDVDWYRIKLYEGTKFEFHTEKFGLFNVPLKVWFYGPYGDADTKINDFRFTASDESSYGQSQPGLSVPISKTGYYYIRLSEKSNSPGTRPRGKNIGAYVFFADTVQTAPRAAQTAGRQNKAALALMNYPNPFNPTTTISYSLPFDARVTLTVYNVLGKVVATPVNTMQVYGTQHVTFDGNELSSGIYIYKLVAVSADGKESMKEVNKFILQK